MSDLNRTQTPAITEPDALVLPDVKSITLQNGIKVFFVNGGSQPVFRVEVGFDVGNIAHTNPLVAPIAMQMLKQGTSKLSSQALNEAIDFYGSFVESEAGKDFSGMAMYGIHRYAAESIQLLADMVYDAAFDNHEFELMVENEKQKIKVGLEKVSFVANQTFFHELYEGKTYGRKVELSDFDTLTLSEVKNHYAKFIQHAQPTLFLSGQINDAILKHIDQHFGSKTLQVLEREIPSLLNQNGEKQQSVHIDKKDAIQSAIRIGRRMFTRIHPDYMKMKVLNTILGGYFGSRLMANIREEKGYTYGIGSAVQSFLHDGFFYIATEVGKDVLKDALKEIYHEIEVLQQEPIDENELQVVKNYMIGSLLKDFDGPFEQLDCFKSVYRSGLTLEFYNKYVEEIKQVSAKELQELALRYLNPQQMVEISVG